MTSTIRFGVISYAHLHAPRYAAAIAAHPSAQLCGIASLGVNGEVAQAEAGRYGVPFFQHYGELLAQPGLQAIYLGSVPTRHREVVAQAADRGVHVLCDKPIATTLDDADAVVGLARRAGIKLMVPFNPRFQLPLVEAKQAMDRGQSGELVSIYAAKYGRLPTKAVGPQDAGWFLDPAQAGGGGFLDIGIHAVDAVRWLAGSEAKRVYAHVGTMIHQSLPADDLGIVTIEFENDVLAVVSAGWANPDGCPAWLDVRFEILTTRQAYLIKSPYHDFTVRTQQRTEQHYWWRRDVDGLVDDFVQAIIKDREPAITGEDGRAALAIVLAACESSRRGRVIDMTEGWR